VQGSGGAPLESLPPQLAAAIPGAGALLEGALARCVALTAGTALPALARVLDRSLQQFVAALQGAVLGMRARVLGEGKVGSALGVLCAAAVRCWIGLRTLCARERRCFLHALRVSQNVSFKIGLLHV
jgi:hypothetical protein